LKFSEDSFFIRENQEKVMKFYFSTQENFWNFTLNFKLYFFLKTLFFLINFFLIMQNVDNRLIINITHICVHTFMYILVCLASFYLKKSGWQ